MATTTNYGWETPDDTDLVKDGAAAIRTLGSSIDTTTKNLNPETTLGDIAYRSSTANTNTRLAIGTTGQVLTVSGGVPTWATPAAGGGLTLLDTKTLNNTVTNYTFSSIPGTYKHLMIVGTALQTSATVNDYFRIQFNSDVSNNYYYGIHAKQNTTFYAEGNNTIDEMRTGFHLARNADVNRYRGHIIITIPEYAGSDYKQCSGVWGSASGGTTWTGMFSGGWDSTSAITSIKITDGELVNLKAGTIKLYGVN